MRVMATLAFGILFIRIPLEAGVLILFISGIHQIDYNIFRVFSAKIVFDHIALYLLMPTHRPPLTMNLL